MEEAIIMELAVKRLGMILEVHAEIEAMKAANLSDKSYNQVPRYTEFDFQLKARRISEITYLHRDQL